MWGLPYVLAIGFLLGGLFCFTALSGCETIQAMSSGELYGKAKPSNYNYGLPDRYRNEKPQ